MDTPPHDVAVAEIVTAAPRAARSRVERPAPAPSIVPRIVPRIAPRIAPDSPERFINRELSWLDFNHRVVEEAENPRHPLLERLRFVSISASNLDEFYSVRVAGLIGQAKAGVTAPSPDGRTPAQQLVEIKQRTDRCWPSSSASGANCARRCAAPAGGLRRRRSSPPDDLAWLDAWFMERVFPVLTPLAIDPAHPFPFIPNMGLVMALLLAGREDRARDARADPAARPGRALRPPAGRPDCAAGGAAGDAGNAHKIRFVMLEDGGQPVPRPAVPAASSVTGQGMFRLIRDTDVEFEEEAEDLVRSYETALKRRRRGVVIHLGDGRRHAATNCAPWSPTNCDASDDEIHVATACWASPICATSSSMTGPTCCSPRTPRASPNASATSAATASPPSAPRTSSSTIRSRVSTWWCNSSARRRAIPTSSR